MTTVHVGFQGSRVLGCNPISRSAGVQLIPSWESLSVFHIPVSTCRGLVAHSVQLSENRNSLFSLRFFLWSFVLFPLAMEIVHVFQGQKGGEHSACDVAM